MTAQSHGTGHGAAIVPTRTPDAIRAALPPDTRKQFDLESRQAMAEAVEQASVEPVQTFLTRWQGIAVLHSNPEMRSRVHAEAERLRSGEGVNDVRSAS